MTRQVTVLPGLALALLLAWCGNWLAIQLSDRVMHLPISPISPIMMAVVLGVVVRNTVGLARVFHSGVRFCLVRMLRIGIILLGIRLSLAEAGEIGLKALPVIIVCIVLALVVVTWLSRRLGLSARLGTLVAAGTGICGATAIVALSPTIHARDEETAYAVACVALFGLVAMLVYPFAAHWLFNGDSFRVGLFLGTAVHDTSQVAGAGLVYQEFYGDSAALNAATVTKLVRNLGMLLVIPALSILYHKNNNGENDQARPGLWSCIPWFVIGFAMMSLLRTLGDLGERPFGVLEPQTWQLLVQASKQAAQICLAIALAAVGLGTCLTSMRSVGLKPLAVGLFSALLVGAVSFSLIAWLY